jgi:four helix bundle protein
MMFVASSRSAKPSRRVHDASTRTRASVHSTRHGAFAVSGMKQQTSSSNFVALECAYELVSAIAPALKEIGRSDNALMKQLTRATASIAMNLAEGSGRCGADRRYHFRVAHGSMLEVEAGFEVAHRFGWLREVPAVAQRRRLTALLWSLAGR